MLIYIIMSLIGCLVGGALIILGIVYRKRIEPSILIAIIFFGIIIVVFCAIITFGLIPFVTGFSLQN